MCARVFGSAVSRSRRDTQKRKQNAALKNAHTQRRGLSRRHTPDQGWSNLIDPVKLQALENRRLRIGKKQPRRTGEGFVRRIQVAASVSRFCFLNATVSITGPPPHCRTSPYHNHVLHKIHSRACQQLCTSQAHANTLARQRTDTPRTQKEQL